MNGLVEPLVSIPVFSCSTNVCRLHFQLSVSKAGSNDPVGTLWNVSVWLHCARTS